MKLVSDLTPLRGTLADWRHDGLRVGFVPTMGNLHAGHLSLVEQIRATADRVVVSVFVNPLQFGPNEDYASYPRTLDGDSAKLEQVATDLLFTPSASLIYPGDAGGRTRIHVPALETMLDELSRPGFFSGVATVVNLLFNLVRPDVAAFGEKDYQQLLVIRRMVADLHLPIEILGAPIVREADGLAMSSRNTYLSVTERRQAPALHAALQVAVGALRGGDRDYGEVERCGAAAVRAAGLRNDYFSVRRAADLMPAESGDTHLRVLAAAWLGRTRLIDNLAVEIT